MNRSRVTGNLSSHGNIFVDIANDRVGIGSTIPAEKLSLPDSAKIALGNNADLQLYHDTSLSQIVSKNINNFTIRQQAGSGFLFIHGDQLHLRSQTTNEPYFVATNNGTVQLYYDNSVKFNTAAIGIVVTGTTDTDGLVVSGVTTATGNIDANGDLDVDGHTNLDNVSIAGVTTITGTLGSSDITITSNQPKLSLTDSSNNPDWSVKNANGNFAINDETAGATRFSINSSNGVEFHMHAVPSADSTYDLGLTGTRWRNVYADTLYGDGSNLTGITQTTINSNADNRIITGSGTANTLNAESTLTFSDRMTFNVTPNQKILLQGSTHPYIHFYENTTAKAYVQWHADGYFRLKNDEDASELRLKDNIQFSADGSNFNTMWHAGNDGSGSGLDADLLDGVQGASYLRSDAEDTITAPLNINGGTANGSNDATLFVTATNNNDWGLKINNYNSSATEYGARIEVGSSANYALQITGNGSEVFRVTGSGTVYAGGSNTVWHAGNDGSGSGLDADTVDGIQGANFVRSDTSDTMSGTLSVDRIDVTGSHGMDNEAWYRNDDSGDGLYNTATGQHFYSDDDDYWNIAGGTNANGLRFRDEHAGTIRGYVYANNSNQVGLLNQSANWTLRTETAGITKLGSAGNGYQIKDGNVSNNLYIFTGATGSASSGISVFNADGAWRFQLYGSSSQYGFLDANWNSWDIQKTPSGAFNVDEGSGLQRVWNAGNDGSGSGLDADTVDGIQGASFVRADASDTVTGAPWQLTNSGTSSWGFRLVNNTGTNNYVYFCHGTHGMHLRNDSAGTSQYLLEVYRSSSAYFKIRGGDCYTTLAGGMQITGTLSSARVHVQAHSDIRLTNGNWTGDYSCKIQHHSNYLYIQGGSNGHIFRRHTGANAWFINGDGHFYPGTNDAYDIGTSGNRVRNLYTTDLQLSNESKKDRGGNNVDGTWGDWTLQEGEDKIFMINNRTGKKYSLIMKEEN